jgi:hypothetical protein
LSAFLLKLSVARQLGTQTKGAVDVEEVVVVVETLAMKPGTQLQ